MFDASSQIYEFIFPGIFNISIKTQLISKIELNSLGDNENAKKFRRLFASYVLHHSSYRKCSETNYFCPEIEEETGPN